MAFSQSDINYVFDIIVGIVSFNPYKIYPEETCIYLEEQKVYNYCGKYIFRAAENLPKEEELCRITHEI